MTKVFLQTAGTTRTAGLIICTAFLAALTGYAAEPSSQHKEDRAQAAQAHATVVLQDDYDYFPGNETYYSRNRHEFVYRDGDAWVRRAEPRGVTADVLLGLPSVRMDFHDAPEQHHSNVVKSYPRNWVKPGHGQDDRKDEKNDRK